MKRPTTEVKRKTKKSLQPIFGASKDLWNDKASISVNVRNVFDSRIYKDQIIGIDYTLNRERFWSGRRFRATFTL